MKTTHLQYLPCKCSWSHSDQIATSKICCNSDKLHTWFCLDSSTHSESSFPQGFPGNSEFTDYKGNLSCKTCTSGIVNCPSLPVLCINFEGENPSYFQITALWTWTHGHYNIHMAYSILSLQNSLNAIISSKDCTLLLRESYRIVICAQSTLHILLQPYDLLNDLKINNKLIYSALYATCSRIWDIARYKTLKSWKQCCINDSLPESHWIIYSSTLWNPQALSELDSASDYSNLISSPNENSLVAINSSK